MKTKLHLFVEPGNWNKKLTAFLTSYQRPQSSFVWQSVPI